MSPLDIPVFTETPSSVTHGLATVHGNEIDLDASRIQALDHLFTIPGQHVIDTFARILGCALKNVSERATVGNYVALISVKSLSALSHLIGRSYETTTKYVTALITCGFIEKQKVKGDRRVYLAIPGGPYTAPLTLLADLDALLARPAARPKVKVLIRQVRERCIAHGYTTDLTPEEDVPGSLQHILAVLLRSEEDSTQRISQAMSLLTKLIATTSTSQGDAGAVDVTKALGDSSSPRARVISPPAPITSTSKGDARSSERHVPSPSQGDAKRRTSCASVVESPTMGDSSRQERGGTGEAAEKSPDKVDASLVVNRLRRVPSTNRVDVNVEISPESPIAVDANVSNPNIPVDSEQKAIDSDPRLNVNVLLLIRDYINNVNVGDNLQQLAELFCDKIFKEPSFRRGIYADHFKRYHNAEAITTALVYTLKCSYRDRTLHTSAGFFLKQNKAFHQAVPAEAAQLVRSYGHLSYNDMVKAFTSSPTTKAAQGPFAPKDREESVSRSSSSAFTLDPKLSVDISRVVMSKNEALTLASAIRQNERTKLFRAQPIRVRAVQGCYVVVMDASIPGGKPHQTIVYSCQDWQTRLAAMKTWRDLFALPPLSIPEFVLQKEH